MGWRLASAPGEERITCTEHARSPGSLLRIYKVLPEGSTTRVGGAAPGCFPFGPASGRFGSYEKTVRVCKVSKLSKAIPAVGQPENVRSVRVVAWHRAARGVAHARGGRGRRVKSNTAPVPSGPTCGFWCSKSDKVWDWFRIFRCIYPPPPPRDPGR